MLPRGGRWTRASGARRSATGAYGAGLRERPGARGREAGGTVDHGAAACAGRAHRGARATRAADPPAKRRVHQRHLSDHRGRPPGADRGWPHGLRRRSGRRGEQRAAADPAGRGGAGRGQRRAPYQSAAAHAACGGRCRRPPAVAADRPRALGRRQLQPLRSRRDRRRSVSLGPAPADRAGLGHAAPSRKSGAVRRRGEQ